jgi:hypothetical protein
VAIDLIVRGICCLRPGVPGLSSRIRVISIVDRYLEHARVSYFENGGQAEYFLASADWMPRNLDRRVEIAFPVLDPDLQARIREILETYCKVGSGRSRFSTRSPAGLFEIEHQRQIGSPHGELEPSDTAQPIFREIILRAYERRLVGPVPPFAPRSKPGSTGTWCSRVRSRPPATPPGPGAPTTISPPGRTQHRQLEHHSHTLEEARCRSTAAPLACRHARASFRPVDQGAIRKPRGDM